MAPRIRKRLALPFQDREVLAEMRRALVELQRVLWEAAQARREIRAELEETQTNGH